MDLLKQLALELSEGYGITETKKIIVKAYDVDENIWPVVVTYEITDAYVNVTEINKLERNYNDLNWEIMLAIEEEEGRTNLNIEI